MKTVGIIGNGFVGNAIYENFKDRVKTKVYDIDPKKSVDSFEEVINSDFIFVCLPTPMGNGGFCDDSYVKNFFKTVPEVSGLFVLKSTVPIGTLLTLSAERSDIRIVHNPEFLTADNAKEDFFNCDRNVIGGSRNDTNELEEFLYETFPEWKDVPCYKVSSIQSEVIKYFSNSFLAVKVAYFNNVYQTCKSLGVDYSVVKDAITEDKRIGKYHTKVPGTDGKMGFGGYCFPKDINALIHSLNNLNIDSELLKSAWNYNVKVRGEYESI
jgi:UDPglucose 6-dehydrogenase